MMPTPLPASWRRLLRSPVHTGEMSGLRITRLSIFTRRCRKDDANPTLAKGFSLLQTGNLL
jgi:hypothetical protein